MVEKIIEWLVWILIFGGIIGLLVGVYDLIDLLLMRK
jgi:hypothetical protein